MMTNLQTRLRVIATLILGIILIGCSVAPPKMVNRYESNQPLQATATRLTSLAKKCWSMPDITPIKAGIIVDSKVALDDSVVINVHRIAWNVGMTPNPFATIRIKETDQSPVVEVSEGEFACTFVYGCHKLDIASHVDKWLSGSDQCYGLSKSLIHM